MARPREFNEQTVLDCALSAFWSKGYVGTSVEDLKELDHYLAKVEARDVPPPANIPSASWRRR